MIKLCNQRWKKLKNKGIKSCPFCGSKASIYYDYEETWIECENFDCGLMMKAHRCDGKNETDDELIARWNHRVTDDELDKYRWHYIEVDGLPTENGKYRVVYEDQLIKLEHDSVYSNEYCEADFYNGEFGFWVIEEHSELIEHPYEEYFCPLGCEGKVVAYQKAENFSYFTEEFTKEKNEECDKYIAEHPEEFEEMP